MSTKKIIKAKYLHDFTVDWNNEIGFAPEFLYENSVPPSYFENEEE